MKRYPLTVPLSTYRGSDPTKRRKEAELFELAHRVVDHINNPPQVTRSFERNEIARAIQADPELVGEVLMRLDGSDNGITVEAES